MKIDFSLTFESEVCGADVGFTVPIKTVPTNSSNSPQNNDDSIQLQQLRDKINGDNGIISQLQKGGETCDDSFLSRSLFLI